METNCKDCNKKIGEEDLLARNYQLCKSCVKKRLEEASKNDINYSEFF